MNSFRCVASLALLLAITSSCASQGMRYPVSERGAVSQTVAFTEIAVTYGRPSARGRMLFGDTGVVRWGRLWHPGADSATRITFNKDVEIEGHTVKAGEYSIWLLPRDGAPWTFILSRKAHVFHTSYPGEENDALRVDITPERGAYMETLTYYFPAVARDSATMRMHWGETFLPVHIVAANP